MRDIIPGNFRITPDNLPIISDLTELIPGGFFIYHAYDDQKLISYNSYMLTLFGCETKEEFEALIGNSFKGIVHPDDYDFVENSIRQQIDSSSDKVDHVKYRIIRKDGSIRMMDDYGHFSESEEFGEIYYVFLQDITKQYQAELEAKQKEELNRDKLISQMTGGVSSYIVNSETGKIHILTQNTHLAENYPEDEDFNTSITRYIENDVFETDRKAAKAAICISAIDNHLKNHDEYTFRYRDISSGNPRWYEMRAVKLSDTEILYGFSDKDEEIIEQMLYRKMQDSYFAIFYINLDANLARIVNTAHPDITGESGSVLSYSTLLQNISLKSEGVEADFIKRISSIEYLKNCFETEDTLYTSYKSMFFGNGKWISAIGRVIFRHEDGTPSIFSLSFSILDEDANNKEEAKAKLAESMEVVGGLASEYTALYHVNLDTDEYVPYYLNQRVEDIRAYYAKNPSFTELAHDYANSELVHPNDRHNMLNFYFSTEDIKMKLKDKKRLSMLFKRNYAGKFLWTEIAVIKCEEESEEAHNAIVGFVEKDREINERNEQIKEAEKANHLIENIISQYNLVFSVNLEDDSFRILRIDEAIILGDKEMKFNCFSEFKTFLLNDLVHPADKTNMINELDYSVIREKCFREKSYSVEYRTLLNNTSSWNEMNVTLISGDTVAIGYALNDMEVTKRHLEDQRFDEYMALLVVDFDTEMIKSMKKQSILDALDVGKAVSYEALMKDYASKCEGDAKEFFNKISNLENVRQQFINSDKATYSYKSSQKEVDKWIDVTGYVILRHEDNTPALATMGFSLSDSLASERQEMQVQLREAYSQLEEARNAAEEASRSKTSFLFNMSHDIRTPMNAITGFTNMAKKYIDEKDRVIDYLDKIDTSGMQLLSLVNQVLEMARIESGKLDIEENPVNIHDEYNAFVVVLAEQAKTNGLEFNHSLVNIIHNRVLADKARIASITLNITGNAMKYTKRGGKVEFILKEIPARKEGYATFVYTVSDTGIGMSEEYLKDLYNPFTREKSSTVSKIQGTGLGMSIVKNLVDLLGGTIEVQSELGKGTRFDITVDFKIDEGTVAENKKEIEYIKKSLAGKRILVVEDNELNREIIVDILLEEGIVVEAADDGTGAVELLSQKGPEYYDAVLMDIQMPIMNGYDATRAIRKMYPNSSIPIIALSANAFSEDREKSLSIGMDAHVAKPINVKELFSVLSRYV